MDIRQTKEYGEYLKSGGWEIVHIDGVRGFLKKILGLKVLKMQRFDKLNWEKLREVKRKNKVLYAILEPGEEFDDLKKLNENGYRINNGPYLPTKTLVIDLDKAEEKLWKELSETSRRWIKKNEDLKVEDWESAKFWREWRKWSPVWITGERRLKELKKAFGKKCKLAVGIKQGVVQSGIVLLMSKDSAFYYQSFTSEEGRKSGGHYKLVWEIIKENKKNDLKKFDFDGIEDSRWPRKSWGGFTEFKKRFGGREVKYLGSFTKWL